MCAELGRDRRDVRVTVALRDLQTRDVPPLADLGVDKLVIVDAPPVDARVAAEWVSAVAERWLAARR